MHNWSIRPAHCVAVNVLFSSPNLPKSENGAGLRRCVKTYTICTCYHVEWTRRGIRRGTRRGTRRGDTKSGHVEGLVEWARREGHVRGTRREGHVESPNLPKSENGAGLYGSWYRT